MIEVEIKAFSGDKSVAVKEDLIKKLRELGFGFDYACDESDCYYQAPDRYFRKTDEALRIRSVRISENVCDGNGGAAGSEKGAGRGLAESRALVTYKGPKQDSESHTRKEIELELNDPDAAADLFKSLGYKPVFTVSKHREVYVLRPRSRGESYSPCEKNALSMDNGVFHNENLEKASCTDISVCLDDVDGLGFAVEIEKLIDDTCVPKDDERSGDHPNNRRVTSTKAETLDKQKSAARQELLGILDKLGIPRSTLTMKTYLEMLLEKSK